MDHPPLSDLVKEHPKGLTSELAFLSGGGEMGELIRSFDWGATPIGPPGGWSSALRSTVGLMLANRFPLLLWWGPQYVSIYNDAYVPILGVKHPKALGQPVRDCWNEIWHILQPLIDAPFHGGAPTWIEDLMMEVNRHGYLEEGHWTVAYSPVPDETVPSGIGGVLATVHEITEKIVAERRVMVLRDLAARATDSKTAEDACAVAADTLARHAMDIPFALLYLIDAGGKRARLAGRGGVTETAAKPTVIDLETDVDEQQPWPLAKVLRRESLYVLDGLRDQWNDVPQGPWSDAPRQAVIVPIRSNIAHRPVGVLVAGVSARLKLDERYKDFYELVAGQIAASIANAEGFEKERQRAEALAELDRAKTAFFSNVSHEFRTPLTLMLGPVEELLVRSHTDLSPAAKDQLEVVNRNGLRLLRLVNNLLDFSRVEAGRVQAVYEPTDLASFTAELVSCFRSATERAGIVLVVDFLPLSETVYVDRDMWEKIVLNLLSNAFKFTFEGEIVVALREGEQTVELRVRDTGVGIPVKELKHLFERFHRIENTRSRTHEGSGIGLALVQELVKLHSGSVRVESRSGEGSTFIVTIPKGSAHLPAEKISARRSVFSTFTGAVPFVEEALRWLPDEQSSHMVEELPEQQELLAVSCPADDLPGDRPRILVADDNADMRQYVGRLLRERYVIEAVPDGEAALAAVRKRRPDLILTDVMMPRLDGFGLLRELRADAGTKTIPVILLSARAGEESRVEGLEHGADDYLIKPFSARELLARVSAHLDMARLRREAGEALRQSEERFARFMQHLPGLAWIKDEQGRYVYANDAAQKTFQVPKERLYGKTDEEVFPPEVAAQFRENDRFALTSGTGVQVVETFQHPDGLLHHSIVSKFPIFGSDGQTALIGGIGIDITDRKQAENALRESEERFRAFINATSDVVYRMNTDWTEMRHLQGREFIADTLEPSQTWLNKYIHPEDQRHVMETIQRAIQSKSVFELEHRVIRVDGSLGWTYLRAIPILDDRGEIVEWFGAASDVTQRKQADEALRKAKERVDIVSEAAEVGFWFCDLPFVELIWDNRVKKHFWLTPDANVTIQTFYERLHPDDRERTRTAIEESIANKARYDIEYRTMSPEGKEKWIRAIGRTFYDEHEKPIRFDGVTLDITQRKRTEERLTQFTAELEGRVAERTYELAESEDQLRTLATELNLAEQRERKRLATELHDHLQQLLVLGKLKVGQSKRLTEVAPAAAKLMKETDDVLSEALTYTRTLVSDLSPTVLRDHGLAAALQWLGTYMRKYHQTVTVAVSDDEDLKLPEDQVILLFQSVRELLINSSKHAGTGEATVRMEQRDGLLRIDVRDEGAGFDLAAAGTPSGGISSKFGLFSIRERMRALGGSFEVESAPGKGTIATLVLPLRGSAECSVLSPELSGKNSAPPGRSALSPLRPLSEASTQDSALQQHTNRIRVLLVDDHPMMRQGLRSIVTAYDHLEVVGEAGDGAEAVELAQRLTPDVVIMDINMPKMDGIEATQQIKASQPTTIVIGLSVYQSTDTEQKMKAAGASAYLTKERAVDALCHAIELALSHKQHRAGSDPALRPSEIKT